MRPEISKRLSLLAITAWMSVCLLICGFSSELGMALRKTWLLSGVLGLISSLGLADVVKRELLANSEIIERFKNEAKTDPLTDLPNRRSFDTQLHGVVDETNEAAASFLAILDVDCFKSINDTYGHPVGDRTLVFVSNVIRDHLPEGSHAARIGGDEFGLIICRTSHSDISRLLSTVSCAIDQGSRDTEGLIPTTVSIGFTQLTANDDVCSAVLRADQALYKTKAAGRNDVTFL